MLQDVTKCYVGVSIYCSRHQRGPDELAEQRQQLHPAGDLGAVEQGFFVGMNGVIADTHFLGDGFSVFTSADASEHFALAGRRRVGIEGVMLAPEAGEFLVDEAKHRHIFGGIGRRSQSARDANSIHDAGADDSDL